MTINRSFNQRELAMNHIDFSDFEVLVSTRGRQRNTTGFRARQEPVLRVKLHLSSRAGSRGQLSIMLNDSLMQAARFVGSDPVKVLFSKDRAMLMIERHPGGDRTLSPVAALKEERDAAIGKSLTSAIKFALPDWMAASPRMREGFLVQGNDLVIDGSRLLAQVNLA